MRDRDARYVNIGLGVYLVLSAFLWTHSSAQFTNTWVIGLIVASSAALALATPAFRYVNTVAGGWLMLSAFLLPRLSMGTLWHNFIAGLVILALSLVGRQAHQFGSRTLRTSSP